MYGSLGGVLAMSELSLAGGSLPRCKKRVCQAPAAPSGLLKPLSQHVECKRSLAGVQKNTSRARRRLVFQLLVKSIFLALD